MDSPEAIRVNRRSLNYNLLIIYSVKLFRILLTFLVLAETHHNPVYPAVAVNHFGQPENFIFF